jgi:2-polyprenyl-3-methyl-5-hydroxy-6-metoxy-1,4-benzoquinol methylase
MGARTWEHLYHDGRWNFLHDLDEMARYAVIAGCASAIVRDGGELLDAGCGEGILLQYLNQSRLRYHGIDWSSIAIERAQARHGLSTFTCVDMSQYCDTATEKYDVIVFNEVLYYCVSPEAVVGKYLHCLKKTGAIIVSMYDQGVGEVARRASLAWRALATPAWTVLYAVQLTNSRTALSWQIRAFRPTGTNGF